MISVQLPKSGFRGTKLPWIENPFRLISWLEMNEFSAAEMVGWTRHLTKMNETLKKLSANQNRAVVIKFLKRCALLISESMARVGCDLAASAAKRLSDQMSGEWTDEKLKIRTDELHANISDALAIHLFFWVPPDRAAFYQQKEPILGSDFATHFASSERDARKAGQCFAFGQYTACVFHIMRVMEIALRAAEGSLQLPPISDRNWGALLERWHSKAIVKFPASLPIYTAHEDFYKDIRATLCAVKDAWRNPTMHVERDYEEDEAKEVMTAVRSFARKLAAHLNEKGQFH